MNLKYGKVPEYLFATSWQPKDEIDTFKPSEKGKRFFVMDVDKAISGGSQTQNFSQYMIPREVWSKWE